MVNILSIFLSFFSRKGDLGKLNLQPTLDELTFNALIWLVAVLYGSGIQPIGLPQIKEGICKTLSAIVNYDFGVCTDSRILPCGIR